MNPMPRPHMANNYISIYDCYMRSLRQQRTCLNGQMSDPRGSTVLSWKSTPHASIPSRLLAERLEIATATAFMLSPTVKLDSRVVDSSTDRRSQGLFYLIYTINASM